MEAARLIEHAKNLRLGQGLVESSLVGLSEYGIDESDPNFLNWSVDRLNEGGGNLAVARLVVIKAQQGPGARNQRVLRLLEERERGATMQEIADALGEDRASVSATLSALKGQGRIIRDPAGVFCIATNGSGPLVAGFIGPEVFSALKTLAGEGFTAEKLGGLVNKHASSMGSTIASLHRQNVIERLPSGEWGVCLDELESLVPSGGPSSVEGSR